MSVNTPPADAKMLKVYGKTIFIFLDEIFPSQSGIRCVLQNGTEFSLIDEALMENGSMLDKVTTDAIFKKALAQLNDSIKKAFGSNSTEPQKGLDRIRWLIKKSKIVDNKIVKGV